MSDFWSNDDRFLNLSSGNSSQNGNFLSGEDLDIDEKVSEQVYLIEEYGKLYKVIIHNDHFTSMEFVVNVLMKFFDKNLDQAYKIMMFIHKQGRATVGMYSREVAETKIVIVKKLAEENEFPLELTMEKIT